nr:glycosyltransferase family A protein [uncultured Psychroserpens sp.]
MSLSIITPHFNDLEGLKQIYTYLKGQTLSTWDWVIVDDKSPIDIQQKLQTWFDSLKDSKVQLHLNKDKTNASFCRNLGANLAQSDTLVFLDADDKITKDFVANRNIDVEDFTVFINYCVINENEENIKIKATHINYLDNFLAAKFLWQTTCVLWNRSFFEKVGRFNPNLPRLQDIELTIRALQQSTNFAVINNPIDFYYKTLPISKRTNFVEPVCKAVYMFVSKLLDKSLLSQKQLTLISGYYFLCAKYYKRSGSKLHSKLVHKNLKLFLSKKYINYNQYVIGSTSLWLYKNSMLTGKQYMKINRYFFKPKHLDSNTI